MRKQYPAWLFVLLLCLSLVSGCSGIRPVGRKGDERTKEETTEFSERDPAKLDEITLNGIVDDILSQMTLPQKVGQMFFVSTDSLDFNAETEMTSEMKNKLANFNPGGVVFFSFNIKSRKQVSSFIKDIQDTSLGIPYFIGVDEEGGSVSRIGNNEKMKTTKIPPMSEIGATNDPAQAYQVGQTISKEIKELGFNLDFAPVADITTNDKNTEIGDRSFGSDPELVSSMVVEEIKGLQENGVCATLKHFPGQGDTGEDTHKGYVDLNTTINRLRKVEFLPFEAGIEQGADLVMVSHVSVSKITGRELPASLSDLIVSDILKDELGFENAVITDALNMKGITKFYDADEAAILAVQAGNDIILMPDEYETAYQGVLNAAREGTVPQDRIDDAVRRILRIKIRRGIIPLSSGLIRQQ